MTAYALAIGNEAGYEIPENELQAMLNGLTDFVEGRIELRSRVADCRSDDPQNRGDRSTVALRGRRRRGCSTASASIRTTGRRRPSSTGSTSCAECRRFRTQKPESPRPNGIVRARLNFQATTMGFSTERSDALWWLMISSDSNAVRALLTLMDRPGVALRHPAHGAWRDRPSTVRPLEYHGRKRVGRPRNGEILRRIRIDAGHRRHVADVRPPRQSRWPGSPTSND